MRETAPEAARPMHAVVLTHPLRIECNSERLMVCVRGLLGGLSQDQSVKPVSVLHLRLQPGHGEPSSYVAEIDGKCVIRVEELGVFLYCLKELMTEMAVRHAPAGLWLVHGSAVRVGERVLVAFGPSGSGKSSLAAALCAEGLDYVSDEVVPIRLADGQVLAFPMGAQLRPHSSRELSARLGPEVGRIVASGQREQDMLEFVNLRGTATSGESVGRVAWIVRPRVTRAVRSRISVMSPLQAVKELLLNSFNGRDVAAADMKSAVRAISGTRAFSLEGDGLMDKASAMRGAMEDCR